MTKCARVMRFKAPLDGLAKVEEVVGGIAPRVRALEGCDGFLFLVDRLTGRSMVVSLWDSEETMQGSEDAALHLRRELIEQGHQQILSIERYEIELHPDLEVSVLAEEV
jgi:hypothetical protein